MIIALGRSLQRQSELSRLIGLAEAQGGDITVARQLYDTMQKVEKLTKLPDNETPTFATIGDVTKLQDQPAFKDAINGDIILLYSKSQWVYIYRPSINKLVSQGPFSLPSPAPDQTIMRPQTPPTSHVPTTTPTLNPTEETASPESDMEISE